MGIFKKNKMSKIIKTALAPKKIYPVCGNCIWHYEITNKNAFGDDIFIKCVCSGIGFKNAEKVHNTEFCKHIYEQIEKDDKYCIN